jgi:hypothetical protein
MPVVGRLMEAWCHLVERAGQDLDPEVWEEFLDLLAACAGRPRAWVDALPGPDFERLVTLELALNEEIWRPCPGAGDAPAMTWAAIVQRLVEHGHPFESVRGLSLAQARAFLLESLRRERADLAAAIQAAGFSMSDGKTLQKVLKELERE